MTRSNIAVSLVATLFISLFSVWSVASAKGSFNDVSFPHPKSIPIWNQPAKWRIGKDVVPMTSILRIDEKGIVLSAAPSDTSQNDLFATVEDYLRTLTFTPLIIDGKKRSGVALAQVTFRPGMGWFDLDFGLDSSGAITDDRLYDSLVALNGCSVPRLASFPSYFCSIRWKDTFTVEPYILFRVSADSTGSVTDVVPVSSTMPSLTSQLQTAARRAKVIPPTFNGKSLASNSYVAVLFFPGNSYPTKPFFSDSLKSGTVLDKSQLRFIPDSARHLALPLPKGPHCDSLYLKKARKSTELEMVTLSVQIQPSGDMGFSFPPGLSADTRSQLRDISTSISFYPAIDFKGRAIEFAGTIRIEFTDSTLVRIRYNWLPSAL